MKEEEHRPHSSPERGNAGKEKNFSPERGRENNVKKEKWNIFMQIMVPTESYKHKYSKFLCFDRFKRVIVKEERGDVTKRIVDNIYRLERGEFKNYKFMNENYVNNEFIMSVEILKYYQNRSNPVVELDILFPN